MHSPLHTRSSVETTARPLHSRPSWLWPSVAIIAVAVAALAYFGRNTLYDRLFGAALPATILVSGNIEAHQAVLGFKTVQSSIVELPFDEGQWVEKGTLIAGLDDSDYRQQVAVNKAGLEMQKRQLAAAQKNLIAAQRTVEFDAADLEFRETEYKRASFLLDKAAGTVQARDQTYAAFRQATAAHLRDEALENAAERQVELVQASIDSAEETLKLSQIVLGYTILRAPFSGVIQVRQAELGEIMVPGTPVVTLSDLDHVWLRAYINETDIGKVRYNQPASVTTDTYPGKKYQGRVTFISGNAEFTPKSVETHAERVTLVYRIRIDIYNPTHELVPGMPADATLKALPAGPLSSSEPSPDLSPQPNASQP
jgi:HlyD family secretion protein